MSVPYKTSHIDIYSSATSTAKAASIDFFLATWGQRNRVRIWVGYKHNNNMLSPYKVTEANVFTNPCLFKNPADMEQYELSCGVAFLAT